MRCARCGFDNPSGFAFCVKCGHSLAAVCPRCNAPVSPDFAFCGKCGAPLQTTRDSLSPSDLDHLHTYLPSPLVEALRFDAIAPPPRLLEQSLSHLNSLLTLTQSHLPAYLVERVMQDPTPGRTAGQFVYGTLLFADISGFTPMSERLSRIGREGAEEITAIVNRYFGLMLGILRERDGQLIKFGGDALLALFLDPTPAVETLHATSLPTSPSLQGDSATRATQAALTMQMAMGSFAQTKTSQGIFPLQMKIAVQRGRFFAAQLGTAQNMEHALFGAGVNATATLEATASAGQVVLEHATLAALSVPHQSQPLANNVHYFVVEQVEAASSLASSATSVLTPPTEPTLSNLKRVVKLLDALTPYLPAGLLPRIAYNPQAVSIEGEHRLIAVLFANVHGLGELADRLGPGRESQIVTALNQYFMAMRHGIQQFGGVINKLDLSEQGDKLLAFFGAPLAHEDDAERAVRAALTMQATLKDLTGFQNLSGLNLTQHIGISYGYVFAGYVGTGWRHEYTVMGDEVNLAARLMATATNVAATHVGATLAVAHQGADVKSAPTAGHIIASRNIQRKTQALFDFEARGEVALKGKSLPVPIFTVQGVRALPEPVRGLAGLHSPLIGRETEWQQLHHALLQLLTGRGQIVSVMGEAGLGKSRLVAELRQQAVQRFKVQSSRFNGQPAALNLEPSTLNLEPATLNLEPSTLNLQWLEGRCLSYSETVSYTPFYDLVRQLTGIQREDGEEIVWNKLRESLLTVLPADDVQLQLPYLAHFLNLTLTADLQEKIRYLDAEALQRRTFVALSAFIEAHARSAPLVLALEDIHWIDQASQALLEHLMPLVNRAPLMLLLLYRPDRDKRCWQIHDKAGREFAYCHTEMLLQKLDEQDSQRLLVNLVQFDRWPVELQQRILQRAEGNPLYLEEVMRALMDAQSLTQDAEGHWHITDAAAALQVPDTLQGVIMARLDRLPEPCRWMAQLASVIGRMFELDVLTNVMAEQPVSLNDCLATLQQHEISRELQRLPEIVYTFKHVMIQEVCYHSLLIRVRRQTHRKIAAYLAARHHEAESMIPLIAHHAFEGQDWSHALRYQLLAGQQAQQLFANQAAIDHFEKALQGAEKLPVAQTVEQRLLIEAALGELLTTTGQYDRALVCLDATLKLARERGDIDAQAHACRWLARLHELRGEYESAFKWIEQGLVALGEREIAETAQLRLIAGLIHTRQGRYDQALAHGENALRIVQALDEVTVLARAYNLLGVVKIRHDSASAIEHFQQAFVLYQRAGDLHGQAITHNQLANAHFNLGQWTLANQHYHQARDIFQRLGDVYRQAYSDNNLGGIALNQGRLADALTLYQAGLQALQQIGGSLWLVGVFHNNLGATFIKQGDVDVARQHLRTSQDYFAQAQARDFLPELHRHWAEAALLGHELPEAETQAQQSVKLARELTMRGEEGSSLRVLGESLLAQGRMDEAELQLRQSSIILAEVHDEYELARSQLALARWLLAQGQRGESLAMLNQCIAQFTQLGAQLDLQAAQALLAQ